MRSSLDRIKRNAPATDEEIRAMAAKALEQGVILFLRADLQRMPWASRQIIETEASRLYGRKNQ